MATFIFVFLWLTSGILLSAALLTDKHVNRDRKDAILCVIAGILWPATIYLVTGLALHENVKERIRAKKSLQREQILRFSSYLCKMRIISRETLNSLAQRTI